MNKGSINLFLFPPTTWDLFYNAQSVQHFPLSRGAQVEANQYTVQADNNCLFIDAHVSRAHGCLGHVVDVKTLPRPTAELDAQATALFGGLSLFFPSVSFAADREAFKIRAPNNTHGPCPCIETKPEEGCHINRPEPWKLIYILAVHFSSSVCVVKPACVILPVPLKEK